MILKRIKLFALRVLPIHIVQLLTGLLPNASLTIRIRGFLISPFINRCGRNFKIASGATINRPDRLTIGNNVYFAQNIWINATGNITFGNNISVGPMCVFASSNHVLENGKVSSSKNIVEPITINSGVWIASHVVITSGVTIGQNSIIAAGAVVSNDVPPGCLYGGVPAKKIKDIEYKNAILDQNNVIAEIFYEMR